ncbi:MAG: hypothetical protein E7672_09405 [Ruminococcaceae bacterium]|nr:hypothetical protein [Oscillospiraceae bacterium]
MKKWFTTLLFLFCLLAFTPACIISNDLIHDVYFEKYNDIGLWDKYYSEMENMQLSAIKIIVIILAMSYLLFIISSVVQMKSGDARTLLTQAAIVQIVILAVCVLLFLCSVIASVVSFFNLIVAVFTLPVIYTALFSASVLLYIAGVLRGIAGIISMKKAQALSDGSVVIHSVLQFIPVISAVDCLILRQHKI